jgi:uncharacterized Ntn-hydrolase superfamily protein
MAKASAIILLAATIVSGSLLHGNAKKNENPVVATFSIVARDPATGELGIAVQSKFVAVGSVVPWAKAGVGAIATQSWANTRYGPIGLKLLERGVSPEKVIEIMTEADGNRENRQVGIVSVDGNASTFTGKKCLSWAGGTTGKNYAAQGNILTGPEVVDAMADTFEKTEGELAERLIAALRAGQKAGGDQRGRQSAALLIVREGWGYSGLNDRYRDLRVDDHPHPIEELERVLRIHKKIFPSPVMKKSPDKR